MKPLYGSDPRYLIMVCVLMRLLTSKGYYNCRFHTNHDLGPAKEFDYSSKTLKDLWNKQKPLADELYAEYEPCVEQFAKYEFDLGVKFHDSDEFCHCEQVLDSNAGKQVVAGDLNFVAFATPSEAANSNAVVVNMALLANVQNIKYGNFRHVTDYEAAESPTNNGIALINLFNVPFYPVNKGSFQYVVKVRPTKCHLVLPNPL
jgi:hypothetical protein